MSTAPAADAALMDAAHVAAQRFNALRLAVGGDAGPPLVSLTVDGTGLVKMFLQRAHTGADGSVSGVGPLVRVDPEYLGLPAGRR